MVLRVKPGPDEVLLGAERCAWLATVVPEPVTALTTVVSTPWSSVTRVSTPVRTLYLKCTPTALFIEAAVLDRLHRARVTDVPRVLAAHPGLGCFLMHDVGDVSLRTLFDGRPDVERLSQALRQYRVFQDQARAATPAFLALGVPDQRLARLPVLFEQLMAQDEGTRGTGLPHDDRHRLIRRIPTFRSAAEALDRLGFAEGLNHSDFHDNNVVIRRSTGQMALLDLGETTVEHPFFALMGFVGRTCGRYGWTVGAPEAQHLLRVSQDGWDRPWQDVQHAWALAARLQPLMAVLAHRRLVESLGPGALDGVERMRHRVRDGLRDLLARLDV